MWLRKWKALKDAGSRGPRRGVFVRRTDSLEPRERFGQSLETGLLDFATSEHNPGSPDDSKEDVLRAKENGLRRPKDKHDPDLEFARVKANMAVLKVDLESSILKVHIEMNTGTRMGDLPKGRIAPEHLTSGSFRWEEFTHSFQKPPSVRLEPFFEQRLKTDSLDDLFELDYELHSLINELDVLNQWWETNHQQWIHYEKEKFALKRNRNALGAQRRKTKAELHDGGLPAEMRNSKAAQLDRLVEQYKLLAKRLDENNRWFEEQSPHMAGVILRFNQLRMRSDAVKSRRPKDEPLPDSFNYDCDGFDIPDMYTPPSWWRNGSPIWWLTYAIQDLEARRRLLDSDIEMRETDVQQCITVLNEELSLLEELSESDATDPESSNRGTTRRNEPNRDMASQLRNMVEVLSQEMRIRKSRATELNKRLERTESLLRFAEDHFYRARDMETEWRSRMLTEDEIFECLYVYIICSLQAFRHDAFELIQEVFDLENILHDDKLWISDRIRSHWEAFVDSQRWVVELPHTDLLRRTVVVENAIIRLAEEWDSLERILNGAEECLRDAEETRASPLNNPTMVPEDTNFNVAAQSGPNVQRPTSWGSINSIDSSQSVLNEAYSRGVTNGGTLNDALLGFFVSPDIASTFEKVSDTLLDEFLKLVNTLVSDDYHFTPREIEAFLIQCTELKELFKLQEGVVSALEEGWELVDEMPTGGPPHNITTQDLPLAHEFELFLTKNQDTLLDAMGAPINGTCRDVWPKVAVKAIRRYYPYDLSNDDVLSLLGAFSYQGKFFRYFEPSSDTDDVIFRRVDNGWHIDPASDLPPLFAEINKPKPYFKALRQLMRSYTVKQAFRDAGSRDIPIDTAESLYNYLEGWLYLHIGNPRSKLTVSRHMFYLFLRWCSEKGDMFKLSRDGTVTIIREGWHKRME